MRPLASEDPTRYIVLKKVQHDGRADAAKNPFDFLSNGGGHLVALHGFIKKTRTTPDEDLAAARKRQKELEQ